MNLLTPIAFALTALLPVIIAMYLLKLPREDRLISSVYLWRMRFGASPFVFRATGRCRQAS